MRSARSAAEAEASFYFEDQTQATPPASAAGRAFNFASAMFPKPMSRA